MMRGEVEEKRSVERFDVDLQQLESEEGEDVEDIDIVGMFPNYEAAFDAWKAAAQRTVDNAHMRYFIAHIHRLRDEETESSPTEELDN